MKRALLVLLLALGAWGAAITPAQAHWYRHWHGGYYGHYYPHHGYYGYGHRVYYPHYHHYHYRPHYHGGFSYYGPRFGISIGW